MYKVNTICIGQHITSPRHVHRNGMECTIVGPLADRPGKVWREHGWVGVIGPCYLVRWADGAESQVAPPKLRRKPFPGEDLIMQLFHVLPVKTTAAARRKKEMA